jgi:hypothetical protein
LSQRQGLPISPCGLCFRVPYGAAIYCHPGDREEHAEGVCGSTSSSPNNPPFSSYNPAGRAGVARQVGASGEDTAQRPAGAKSHKPQCLHPALGLSAGKAGGRGGDPKPSPPGQATPWPPQGGAGRAHTVHHKLSSLLRLNSILGGPSWSSGRGWWLQITPLQSPPLALCGLLSLLGTVL